MKNIQKGQSLFEIVIAVVIVSVVLISLLNLATISVSNSSFAKNKNSASKYTEELNEWLRSERDRDWNFFSSSASAGSWCFPSLSWTSGRSHSGNCGASDKIQGTIFTRYVIFSYNPLVDPNTVSVDVTTSWNDSLGLHVVTTSNIFTNWKSR